MDKLSETEILEVKLANVYLDREEQRHQNLELANSLIQLQRENYNLRKPLIERDLAEARAMLDAKMNQLKERYGIKTPADVNWETGEIVGRPPGGCPADPGTAAEQDPTGPVATPAQGD